MRKIKIPEIDFQTYYDECISNIRLTRRNNCINAKAAMTILLTQYSENADIQNLHSLSTDNGLPPLSKTDLLFLYKSKLAKIGQPGRKYYDEIMLASKRQICPYCDCAPVEELDHVLAKNHYSRFSIIPNNLIPACGACNKSKRDKIITSKSEMHLHPYYDNEATERWLHAKIIPSNDSINIKFLVKEISEWNEEENLRAKNHFKTFKLNRMFSITAVSAIYDDTQLVPLYKQSPNSLREHLTSIARSNETHKLNFWKTAMFCALRDSNWFCNGGVLNIEK